MRKAYRILADVIAVAVAIQSMLMVWAISGLFHWVKDGGTLNSKVLDSWDKKAPDFQGAVGFALHGMIGGMLIPVVALALLVVAFFAGVEGGVKWAGILFALVLVQMGAGMAGTNAPWLGLFHGLVPFALFSLAIVAARSAHGEAQTASVATP